MFNKILVPLDGSGLAEGVLRFVSQFAEGYRTPLLLATVIDPDSSEGSGSGAERIALERLEALVSRVAGWGLQADTLVSTGPPAKMIVEMAGQEGCDLIAMSTHGRGGLGRAILGSVADELIRASDLPILVIAPERARSYWQDGERISTVLVPLDGSDLGESVLPYVESLADKLSLEVELLRVTMGAISTPYSGALSGKDVNKEIESKYLDYLDGIGAGLRAKGLEVRSKVLFGAAAYEITKDAKEMPGNIIVVATHGRSGLDRWTKGSVADAVIRLSGDPVLIVPRP
jgi:nucleotide-binding universal stress UspA family protein